MLRLVPTSFQWIPCGQAHKRREKEGEKLSPVVESARLILKDQSYVYKSYHPQVFCSIFWGN